MALKVVCEEDKIISYSLIAQSATLSATATGGATSMTWTLLSVPASSTAMSETRGDFVNGAVTTTGSTSSVQFVTDAALAGTYVFRCVASDGSLLSSPVSDKQNGQQCIVVQTQLHQLSLPNNYQYDWSDYVNNNFLTLESLATHALGGAQHTQSTLAELNTKLSDATLDDSSDSRTPTAHASEHEITGGDVISVAGLSGVLADKQDADKLQGRAISTNVPSDSMYLVWDNALSQWVPKSLARAYATWTNWASSNISIDSSSEKTIVSGAVSIPNTGKYIVRVVSGGYAYTYINNSIFAWSLYIDKGLGSEIKIGNNDRWSCGMLAAYANRVVRFHFEDVATSITAGTRTLTFVGRRVSGSSIYQHGTGQNSVAAVTFLSVDKFFS